MTRHLKDYIVKVTKRSPNGELPSTFEISAYSAKDANKRVRKEMFNLGHISRIDGGLIVHVQLARKEG